MSRQDYLYFVTSRSEEELLVSFLQPFAPLPPVNVECDSGWCYYYCDTPHFEAGASKSQDWLKEALEEDFDFISDMQIEIDHHRGESWSLNETECIQLIAIQLKQTTDDMLYSLFDRTVLLKQRGKLFLIDDGFWTDERLALIDFPYEMRPSLEGGTL